MNAKMTADAALVGMMQALGWWFDATDARKQITDEDLGVVADQLYAVVRMWRVSGCPGVAR